MIPAAPTILCLVDVNLDTFYASIWNCRSDFKANWPNVDTLNLLRRLGVPSAVGLPQIQNQQLTSPVAQMKKLWTYRLCPRRWKNTLYCITVQKCVNISQMSKYGEKTTGDVCVHKISSLQHKHRLSNMWSCCNSCNSYQVWSMQCLPL